MRNRKILALIMGGALLLASCGGQEAAPAPKPTETPSTIDASGLYSTNCVACHGADREGVIGLGKPLTSDALAPLSNSAVKDIILNGRPNTLMTSWKDRLSQEEIDALAQFLKNSSP